MKTLATDWKEIATGGAEIDESKATKRQPLTIRTIAEILDMTFDDDSEMILANGYLTNGERTAVCGMGGVGKTRLIMQLALCCRAGRNFLTWSTRGRESVFLFLQTENSCRRLKFDLERMLTGFTAEECDRIKNGIFFHTLEQDEDGFLMLDLENSERIANAIAKTGANVVVFDPLRDFGSDDLNSDRYMAETLREISRVTKRGNPNRALLVIHHAGTGKAGIQKTLGFDRSSFGRNSKVLFSWARAQINVAPALPDDNSLIIIASGKCSNAPEFEPFAARLNPENMLYEIDEGFDMESWRQELGSSTSKTRLKPAILRDLLQKGREYEKKQIVALIIEDKGVSKARAYQIVDQAHARKILRYNQTIKTYELT
jgi:AAA domain